MNSYVMFNFLLLTQINQTIINRVINFNQMLHIYRLFIQINLIEEIQTNILKFCYITNLSKKQQTTFMLIKNVQFQINRKTKSLSSSLKTRQTISQGKNNRQTKSNHMEKTGYCFAKRQFEKLLQRSQKCYSSYSRNSTELNLFNKNQNILINNINNYQKAMKKDSQKTKALKGFAIPQINFNSRIVDNFFIPFQQTQKKYQKKQVIIGKQAPFFSQFSTLKRPKYLSLHKKDKQINQIKYKKSRRIQTQVTQQKNFDKETEKGHQIEFKQNNFLLQKEIKRKNQFIKKNQFQKLYFPLVKKQKLHLR